MAAWAQHNTPLTVYVAGMALNYKTKGQWTDAALGRCGLHLDSLRGGKRSTHGQYFLKALTMDVLPAVRQQVQALLGQAEHA